MPAGRKSVSARANAPKAQVPLSTVGYSSIRSNSNDRTCESFLEEKRSEESFTGKPLAPKHVPIPVVPVDGELTFEVLSLAESVIAASLQMLNLYRTVWWLPHSYNNYTMNFYLINPYLLIFIGTMVARGFIYKSVRSFLNRILPVQWSLMARKTIKMALLTIVMTTLCWCLYYMAQDHSLMKIFYLCYPSLSIYFVMFGISVTPFFDILAAPAAPAAAIKEEKKSKLTMEKPVHNCSLNAATIRAEVAALRGDFNHRLKQALFASSSNAYVCGVAPIIFAPQHLHFNVLWVVQHVVMFWLGRICAHFSQAYPMRYCDILHRASLHLGRWIRIDDSSSPEYAQVWNDSALWPHGSVVRHNKEIYRSEGVCTVAEPGNPNHYRFYDLFSNPTMLLSLLLSLHLFLLGTQLFVLLRASDWYQTLSMTLLLIINYYTLFKIARDYLISWKVYHAEKIIQEKSQSSTNLPLQ